MKRLAGYLALSVTVLLACSEDPVATVLEDVAPAAAIVDAAHDAGVQHFYFLPPMVPTVDAAGVFDATLHPSLHVTVCAVVAGECGGVIALFSADTGPGSERVRLDAEAEHYSVNWHTNGFDLDALTTYRIEVTVAGTLLGYADVDVVSSGKELKNVDTGEYIALEEGRTLPIKFRIEEGAVFVVGASGGSFIAADGAVTIDLPAGALPAGGDVGITVTETSDDVPGVDIIPGTAYEFEPDGTNFDLPVELTLAYDPNLLPPGVDETSMFVLTQEDGVWQPVPTVVDPATNTATGWITGFSAKALGGPATGPGQHTCTVAVTGEGFCWGLNSAGQLGDGTQITRLLPSPVSGGTLFSHVAVGNFHTCGIDVDGSIVWC
jgi:hypothetical protein